MAQTTSGQKRQVLVTLIASGCLLSLYGIYQFFWGFQNILDYLSQKRGIENPHISQYVALYLKVPKTREISKTIKVRHLKYNKSLNDQGVRP